jgi:oligopeptidase B
VKKIKIGISMSKVICPKKKHSYEIHSSVLEDNYHWLRDDNWPNVNDEIMQYLKAENAYTEEVSKNFSSIESKLFEQMKARVIEEDVSYPVTFYHGADSYSYYYRIVANREHKLYCRRKNDGDEEVLLDVNLLAGDNKAFSLGDFSISLDHKRMLYSEDHSGKERFTIKVKDLVSNKEFESSIKDTIGQVVWSQDSNGFYYLKVDDNWRSNMVYYHHLGSEKEDILIYHELDDSYHLSISSSSEEDYLIININCNEHNEVRVINLKNLSKDGSHAMEVIIPREAKTLYEVDYHNDQLYMLTNDHGKNFRLVTRKNNMLLEVIPYSDREYLTDMFFVSGYLIVTRKVNGLNEILIYKDNSFLNKVKFQHNPYEARAIYTNKDDKFLRISYDSLTTPNQILEYDFSNGQLYSRKSLIVPNYNDDLYTSKRIFIMADDNHNFIPVSLVYRRDTKLEDAPMLLYGYGSYGISIGTNFSVSRSVLLDQGFVYAIAHIRGGDELGFDWYEQAKFLNKKITFEDFACVAQYFIKQGVTSSKKLSIMGGSAGGMLVAYMLNNYPDLFNSALALVPFVDVLNTMLDENLPLTPGEFHEWGNPKEKRYFDYIKSYCPYSNIQHQDYPNILVTAGINDPRVTYWEPAKFVAKLREFKTDNNLLLLKTEMDQGHKGQYGKYNALKEMAYYYAFIIYTSCNSKSYICCN